jgi:hypothetical protein
MKKHMKEIIRQAKQDDDTTITAIVLEHFRDQGFEIVSKKDLKKTKKTIKQLNSTINELVHDNWEIAMRLYESEIANIDQENTNVYISSKADVNPITTQAETAGLRQGADAKEMEMEIDVIINSLDNHINKMTKVIDDANLTRIKFELDEQEAMLDEPMDQIDDPAMDEAVNLYMYYIEMDHTPYQARLMALLHVKEKIEDTGYEAYWIDVYNNLKLVKFTI